MNYYQNHDSYQEAVEVDNRHWKVVVDLRNTHFGAVGYREGS